MKTRTWAARHVGMPALLTLGALLCLSGCNGEAELNADTKSMRVSVVGASTIAPLISELAKAYEKQHPGVRIEVQAGGSARGIMDVRSGTAVLGMVSRDLKADEQDLEHALIAKDGIGMIVNKSNPVVGLSKAQVIAIYTGQISNWKEVGGNDAPITVVSKAEGRSTLEIFSSFFGIPYKDIRAHVIIGDNQQGIQTIAGSPDAVGYVSIGSAEYEAGQGAAIRLIPMDDQIPSTASVASGQYAISRDLNLVYKAPLNEQVRDFVAYAQSKQAEDFVTRMYFIPVVK
ncbi:phosphate ABC transporter substrate-binding protein [Pseudomonas sp. BP01]|uniref:phosphate ABC transporter substrate-binding protein n=1 Tax=Pseudomonas sp. BP01 TaxID=2976152 RepID=UPI001FAB0AB4|nr:phosphate ABC transporter substrate-binding protein [Pseudomonas sp. BP01]